MVLEWGRIPLNYFKMNIKYNGGRVTSLYLLFFCESGGMGGFCARRAQKALFQTHSALTDAVFYTKILDSKSPDFFGTFAADFGGTLLTKIAKLF